MAYYLAKVAKPEAAADAVPAAVRAAVGVEVLRAFAWFIILAFKGPLNALLLGLGIIEEPIRWISGLPGRDDRAGLYLCAVHAVPDLQRDPVAGHQPDRGGRRPWRARGGKRIGG